MYTISQIKEHLMGMGHGGTLNKVRNIEAMFERAASTFLLMMHPLESMRNQGLVSTIHDDTYNYQLADDFGSIIDLSPADDTRTLWDKAYRDNVGNFDREKAIRERTLSIEGSDGVKIARIKWNGRKGKVLNTMDSLTENGTWTAYSNASNVKVNTVYKKSGTGSIQFDAGIDTNGLQNTTMTPLDLSLEEGLADIFIWVEFGSDFANFQSLFTLFGNGALLLNTYQTLDVSTQADGLPVQKGWNLFRIPWSTATLNGPVDASAINSMIVGISTTAEMKNIRVDNIVFSLGRNFDLKYYSNCLFKDFTTGLWKPKPATGNDDDYVMIGTDTLPHFLMECLKQMAHQMEGTDSVFDITFAEKELMRLYPAYKGIYPSQVKKISGGYGSKRPGRGRW